ncbi:MAG: hypothetical protein ACT4P7_06710 [Gemmatimonadaceae bacterium]
MHTNQKFRLSMFRRVRELLASEPATAAIAIPVAELDGVITRLSEFGARQDEHQRRRRALTAALQEQSRMLRHDLMRPVALAARTVFPKESGDGATLRQSVRMPVHRADYEQLIVTARGMAAAVEEHAARFIAVGLPPDFVGRLRAGADALVAAVDARSQEEQRRVASTQGVGTEAQRGLAVVRLLNALVKPTLRGDPARAAEWGKAIRLARSPSPVAVPVLPVVPVAPNTSKTIGGVAQEVATGPSTQAA